MNFGIHWHQPSHRGSVDVVLHGDTPILAVSNVGLKVLDDTDHTTLIDTSSVAQNPRRFSLCGDRLYVADASSDVVIADAADPCALTGLGTVAVSGTVSDVHISTLTLDTVRGTYRMHVFNVADGENGLLAYDVGDAALDCVKLTLAR